MTTALLRLSDLDPPIALLRMIDKGCLEYLELTDSIADNGGTTSQALKLARHAAEPPPSSTPQREKCQRGELFALKRGALLDAPLMGRSGTGALASLWLDGGFSAAARKQERAELSQWRAKRVAWSRANGLRRQLVLAIAEKEVQRERRADTREREHSHRMMLWRVEDSAAVVIQDAYREKRRKRRVELEGKVTEQLVFAKAHKQVAGDRKQRLRRNNSLGNARERSADSRKQSGADRRAADAQVEARALKREAEADTALAWTADKPLQEVSEHVAASLEPLLARLRAQLEAPSPVDLDEPDEPEVPTWQQATSLEQVEVQ